MPVEIIKNYFDINNRKEKIDKEVNEFKKIIKEKFNSEEQEKIDKAIDLMLRLHLNQADRADGQPYAKHLIEVAKKVLEVTDKPKANNIISALLHDAVEDKADELFAIRANRKFLHKKSAFKITDEIKNKYKEVFKNWAFREINYCFGKEVEYNVLNLTNHDFDSLAEDLNLSGEEKIKFKHNAYKEHVQEIIKNADLCLLKYADFCLNIDLRNLNKDSEKYKRMKRIYRSVIPIFINELKKISEGHPLYKKKKEIIDNLEEVYEKQYN